MDRIDRIVVITGIVLLALLIILTLMTLGGMMMMGYRRAEPSPIASPSPRPTSSVLKKDHEAVPR